MVGNEPIAAVAVNRWFIVVKRKDGSLIFASKSCQSVATQQDLLVALEVAPEDTVLELFQSASLDPHDFHTYCRESYKHLLPKQHKFPADGAKAAKNSGQKHT